MILTKGFPAGASKSENNLQSCLFQAENVKDYNEESLKANVHIKLGQRVHWFANAADVNVAKGCLQDSEGFVRINHNSSLQQPAWNHCQHERRLSAYYKGNN